MDDDVLTERERAIYRARDLGPPRVERGGETKGLRLSAREREVVDAALIVLHESLDPWLDSVLRNRIFMVVYRLRGLDEPGWNHPGTEAYESARNE
jgi:hypothetical protein